MDDPRAVKGVDALDDAPCEKADLGNVGAGNALRTESEPERALGPGHDEDMLKAFVALKRRVVVALATVPGKCFRGNDAVSPSLGGVAKRSTLAKLELAVKLFPSLHELERDLAVRLAVVVCRKDDLARATRVLGRAGVEVVATAEEEEGLHHAADLGSSELEKGAAVVVLCFGES